MRERIPPAKLHTARDNKFSNLLSSKIYRPVEITSPLQLNVSLSWESKTNKPKGFDFVRNKKKSFSRRQDCRLARHKPREHYITGYAESEARRG